MPLQYDLNVANAELAVSALQNEQQLLLPLKIKVIICFSESRNLASEKLSLYQLRLSCLITHFEAQTELCCERNHYSMF